MPTNIKDIEDEKLWTKYFEVYDTLLKVYPYKRLLLDIANLVDEQLAQIKINTINIIDLGCGTGNIINELIENVESKYPQKNFNYYGLDSNQAALLQAEKKLNKSNIFLYQGDVSHKGFSLDKSIFSILKTQGYNIVISNNVFYVLNLLEKEAKSIFKKVVIDWVEAIFVHKSGAKIDHIRLPVAARDQVGFGFEVAVADTTRVKGPDDLQKCREPLIPVLPTRLPVWHAVDEIHQQKPLCKHAVARRYARHTLKSPVS